MGGANRLAYAARVVLFLLMATVFLFPAGLMVTNSFSPAKAFLRSPPSLVPYAWTLENYQKALSLRFLPRWIVNTVLLAAILIVGSTLITGAAGYVFCFARFRWARILFWLMMAPIFVTRYVLLISQFVIIGKLHLDGMVAVASMSLFWSTGIYLFRNYFKSIPASIIESARIDGANEWTILTRIVLPVSKPIVGTSIVFLGMGALGDYIWQMLCLQTPESQTFLVGLMASTLNVYVVKNIGYDLAIGTLLFLPYLALFALSSRYFIGGLTGGALKE